MSKSDPDTWKAVKELAGELRTLAPSLLASQPEGTIARKSGSANVDARLFGRYLIAVNSENTPARCTFLVKNGKRPVTDMRVFGEGRAVAVRNGCWTDDFDPYAVHIYQVD